MADSGARQPTLRGRLLAIGVGVLLTLVLAEIMLRIVMPGWRDFHSGRFIRPVLVPNHGVVSLGVPGFDGYFEQNNGDFRVHVTLNGVGLRDPEPVLAADGRVWVVGDSMTFGWGVEQDEMYSAVIQRIAGTPTYNVASPGTDVCGYEALLARMPKQVKPRAVIVGLILENDIAVYDCQAAARRTAAAAKAGTDDSPLPKSWIEFKYGLSRYFALYNFMAVTVKRVAVIRKALIAIGVIRAGHAYTRHVGARELEKAVRSTADEIVRLTAMLPAGTPFAVLVAPARFEIKDGDPFYRKLRLEQVKALQERGIAVIDPFKRFVAAGFKATHFAHDGHWSALGHSEAGTAAGLWLKAHLEAP